MRKENSKYGRFEFFMVLAMNTIVFWDVTPCDLVDAEEPAASTIKTNLP